MTSKVPCKYYASGCCAFGDSCRFSHEGAPGSEAPSQVCKFFLAGNCAYGNKCRFEHSAPGGEQQQGKGRRPPAGVPDGAWGVYKWPSGADEFGLMESSQDPNPNWDEYMDPDEMEAFAEWQRQQRELGGGGGGDDGMSGDDGDVVDPADIPLCTEYEQTGGCAGGDDCPLIHGDQCEVCGMFSIHPYNPELIEQHKQECSAAAAAAAAAEGQDGAEGEEGAEGEGGVEGEGAEEGEGGAEGKGGAEAEGAEEVKDKAAVTDEAEEGGDVAADGAAAAAEEELSAGLQAAKLEA